MRTNLIGSWFSVPCLALPCLALSEHPWASVYNNWRVCWWMFKCESKPKVNLFILS